MSKSKKGIGLLLIEGCNDTGSVQSVLEKASVLDIQEAPIRIIKAQTLHEGLELVKTNALDIVLLSEAQMYADEKSISETIRLFSGMPVLICADTDDLMQAGEAIRQGVGDYLLKSEITPAILLKSIFCAIRQFDLAVQLDKNSRKLRMLSECNQSLLHAKTQEELLDKTCGIIHAKGGYPVVWIGLIDPENPDILLPKAVYGITLEGAINMTKIEDKGACPLYRTLRDKTVTVEHGFIISLLCQMTDEIPESIQNGVSLLGLPLLADGELLGIMAVYSNEKEKSVFEDDEVRLLSELANDIAYGIQNLKTVQREYALSELNNLLLENAGEGIFGVDVNGNVTFVNDAACKMLGYQKEELLGGSQYTLFHRQTPINDKNKLMCPGFQDGQQQSRNDEFFLKKDGSPLPVDYTYAPIVRKGVAIGAVGVFRDITEAKKSYEALLESKAKFRNLVEASSDFIWEVDVEGRYTYVSPKIKELLGYEQDEVIGKRPFDLMHPDEAKRVVDLFKRFVAQKAPVRNVVNVNRHKNGTKVVLETSGNPILNDKHQLVGYRGVDRDITEKVKIEESLRQYQRIVDTSNDLMSYLDKHYVYLAVNQAYLKMWGKQREEIIGHNASELVGEDVFKNTLKPNLDSCLKGEHISFQAWFGYAKERRYMDVHYYPYKNRDGGVDGIVVNVHDMTEVKKMEESIKEKDEMMLSQSRQAAMGEMIAMIAHQWRQPISAIGMAVNNLKADIELGSFQVDEAVCKYDEISEMILFLSQTIDDFRDFFRTENEKESVSLDEIIHLVIKIIGKSFENNGIGVELTLDAAQKTMFYKREMIQVCLNILQNAKDVLMEREIEEPKITIQTYVKEGEGVVEFCDNGGGVAPDIVDRIYEPYFTTKGPSSGTGLGLYMSKMIIEQHHKGVIEFKNTGEGSCFTIKVKM